MKKLIIFTFLMANQTVFASVVKSIDENYSCNLFRVTTEETPITQDEVIINTKDAYGLTFVDMEIDFKNQTVSVQPVINTVLGLDKNLIPDRAIISPTNSDFKYLINQLNRRIFVFEKICITNKNEIKYAKEFEPKDQSENLIR